MIIASLRDVSADSWWIVDAVVDEIYSENPDFQRPGGDYESWYIRDEASGDYLTGFESWPRVDGAMLRFMITGPLHWLGLADLGRFAGGMLGRLNAYGRAFVSGGRWPASPDKDVPLALHEDGTAEASRRMSRYDRFQLARFTEWLNVHEGSTYRYRFSPGGLRRATIQGIQPGHVRGFLARKLGGDTVPDTVKTLLERWEHTAEADATIEQITVLRTASAEALDAVYDDPAVRRYLGARLGPDAVIVRPGQAAALQNALAQFGVLAEWSGSAEEAAPAV